MEELLLGRGREVLRAPAGEWRAKLEAYSRDPDRYARLRFMTQDHRRVRNFLVVELARNGGRPVPPREIAGRLGLDGAQVASLLAEMEERLFFLVRNRAGEVTWAFPVTAERTPHHLRFGTGESTSGA